MKLSSLASLPLCVIAMELVIEGREALARRHQADIGNEAVCIRTHAFS